MQQLDIDLQTPLISGNIFGNCKDAFTQKSRNLIEVGFRFAGPGQSAGGDCGCFYGGRRGRLIARALTRKVVTEAPGRQGSHVFAGHLAFAQLKHMRLGALAHHFAQEAGHLLKTLLCFI